MITEKIHFLREQKGISQNKLAKLANVPQCTISKLEAGKKDIYLSTAEKLLHALGYELLIGVLTQKEGGEL